MYSTERHVNTVYSMILHKKWVEYNQEEGKGSPSLFFSNCQLLTKNASSLEVEATTLTLGLVKASGVGEAVNESIVLMAVIGLE